MDYSKEDYEELYNDGSRERIEEQVDAYALGVAHTSLYVVAILIVVALAGCASIEEHTAPPDWPKLTVRDNVVGGAEVLRRCYKYIPTWQKALGTFPMACAEINFVSRTCNIWRAHDATEDVIEHEKIHCRGGQHPGDTTLADAWNAYRGRK